MQRIVSNKDKYGKLKISFVDVNASIEFRSNPERESL